jgi:hypothetical protein
MVIKNQQVNAVEGVTALSENRTKKKETLCWQKVEFLYVKPGGTSHTLKG